MIWAVIASIVGPAGAVVCIIGGTRLLGKFNRAHTEKGKYFCQAAFCYFVSFCGAVVTVIGLARLMRG